MSYAYTIPSRTTVHTQRHDNNSTTNNNKYTTAVRIVYNRIIFLVLYSEG